MAGKSVTKARSTSVDEVNLGGRPSSYSRKLDAKVKRLCLLGATDAEIAEQFDITVQTLSTWKNQHPRFLDAMQRGKLEADSRVAASLYKRALGCTIKKEKLDPAGGIVELREELPPDVQAAFVWLRNRRRQYWRADPSDAGGAESRPFTGVQIVVSPGAQANVQINTGDPDKA